MVCRLTTCSFTEEEEKRRKKHRQIKTPSRYLDLKPRAPATPKPLCSLGSGSAVLILAYLAGVEVSLCVSSCLYCLVRGDSYMYSTYSKVLVVVRYQSPLQDILYSHVKSPGLEKVSSYFCSLCCCSWLWCGYLTSFLKGIFP